MSKYKILIADSRYPAYDEEESALKPIDAEIVNERSDDPDTIAGMIGEFDGLIVNLAPITAKVIGNMTKCKCVSRYGVGYDNVDTDALKEKGVFLANVPGYCVEDVSDHAMALLLDCVRKVARKDRLVRQGQWNLTGIQPCFRLTGKTVGLVGFGMIARIVHRKLSGFNLGRVLITDPFVSAENAKKAGVESVDLETLCRESDFISVHAPLLPATRGMIGAEQFKLMKPTAGLINTSRGPLIDENALAVALKTGEIACGAIDVFGNEPLEADSPLRELENITLSDHAGWYSEESMVELKTEAANNIAHTLTTGKPKYPVEL